MVTKFRLWAEPKECHKSARNTISAEMLLPKKEIYNTTARHCGKNIGARKCKKKIHFVPSQI